MTTTTTEDSQAAANKRFDSEAAEWDSKDAHVQGAKLVFEALRKYVPGFEDGSAKDYDVLELGSGTGLVSFKLAPRIRSLVGVDASAGMVSAFNAKIATLPDPSKANLAAVQTLLESADDVHLQGAAAALATRRGESGHDTPYRFDLIISHLTLHHLPSLPAIIATLFQSLKYGGWIALTDYEDFGEGAVEFHSVVKREGVVRHGLKKDEIEMIIDGTGFNEVKVERAFSMMKDVEGTEKEFPFLICLGKRS